MTSEIPVLVLTGFLGAGKTTLLNRLLGGTQPSSAPATSADAVAPAGSAVHAGTSIDIGIDAASDDGVTDTVTSIDPDRLVVLVNEVGQIGLDHQLVRHVDDRLVMLESGCICCSVRGGLVTALQDLFMAALQRRIRPFTHIVIETTGIADPAAIRYTLAFERFLADRYRYAGCVTVVDAGNIQAQFVQQPEVAPQLAQADCLLISKADQVNTQALGLTQTWLDTVCPQVPRLLAGQVTSVGQLFDVVQGQARRVPALGGAVRRHTAGLFGVPGQGLFTSSGSPTPGAVFPDAQVVGDFSQPVGRHADLDVASWELSGTVKRADFSRALDAAVADTGAGLLRFKGILFFEPGGWQVVQVVHNTVYPPQPLEAGPTDAPGAQAVVITRGSPAEDFFKKLEAGLAKS
ncbi:hypothetical protein PuT2_09355 [Pusillimonas sp. T2]|uniref:CobW family GTP-binding protein n=1 Tax=Pusillimonas sp. T2 TaxID=1548123 RepID=UPI000B9C9BFB|nr:GTP-binding protein [Pusillimonas sp. T2]OXR49219.1 hypothetical protein PuT2_09355 [Pusillimonas sp. T2]